jgi:adenosylmethionine-8-amino-7-oxononanoate aminotransferase
MNQLLQLLNELPAVIEVRQCGFITGIEMADELTAAKICRRVRVGGLLTRNIRNVVVLMPPLCTTVDQLDRAASALRSAIMADHEPAWV